jgi:hypothetical protein
MPAAPYSGAMQPDYDLGTNLTIFIWTCTAVSAVFLALRLFAVYYVLNRVRAADYVMTAAFVRPPFHAPINPVWLEEY